MRIGRRSRHGAVAVLAAKFVEGVVNRVPLWVFVLLDTAAVFAAYAVWRGWDWRLRLALHAAWLGLLAESVFVGRLFR